MTEIKNNEVVKKFTDEERRVILNEAKYFLENIEINESFFENSALLEEFFRRRRKRLRKIVDFRRSQATKRQWRTQKHKMKTAIRRFHRSLQGKRFQKALQRFNLTREALEATNKDVDFEFLKAISSLKTHIYIECEQVHDFETEVLLHESLDLIVEALTEIEQAVLARKPLDEDMRELIAEFC